MKSKWYEIKEKAIFMRKKGRSIRNIEKHLGVRRSTLSGWLRNIPMTEKQKILLHQKWEKALVKARKKAAQYHKREKTKRVEEAKMSALQALKTIHMQNDAVLELGLAMLYLGEGFKKSDETALGNSDPMILQFFLAILKRLYGIEDRKIRCELHLRADQNPEKLKRFWARKLKLSMYNFKHVSIDNRTAGSKTFPTYKGVCIIRCGRVDIQRKLLFLAEYFCKKVIEP